MCLLRSRTFSLHAGNSWPVLLSTERLSRHRFRLNWLKHTRMKQKQNSRLSATMYVFAAETAQYWIFSRVIGDDSNGNSIDSSESRKWTWFENVPKSSSFSFRRLFKMRFSICIGIYCSQMTIINFLRTAHTRSVRTLRACGLWCKRCLR